MITSKSNELIKKVTSLKEKKYRNLHGEFIVEGIKQIREAVFSELEIVHIFYSPLYNGEFQNHSCAVPVSEDVFSKLSEEVTPQGILAVLKIPHILCEKPLALNEEQAREMFAVCEENHVLLMEAFAFRHAPLVQKVKELIGEGAVGKVKYLESHKSYSGHF